MLLNSSCKTARLLIAATLATLCFSCSQGVAQTVTGPGPIPAEDQFFDSGGVHIRYASLGQGEPIILIHGWSASAEMWSSAIRDLSRDYRVIAMDCRGHGRSDKPTDPSQYGMEMVNDVVRLMDHLGIAKAHIVGYSMGGSIALKMLTARPERFLTAVVGGSQGFRLPEDFDTPDTPLIKSLLSGLSFTDAQIANAPPGFPKATPEQRKQMEQMNANQNPKALAAVRLSYIGLKVDYDALQHNAVPTLVIYGGNDNPSRFDELKKVLANGEFKEIAGAGHMAAAFSPEFVKDVRDFLARHATSSQKGSSAESDAGKQVGAWLAAYNSGDRPQLERFYAKYFPARQSMVDDDMQRRRNMTGGYEMKKLESCNSNSCSAILKMRDLEEYVRLRMAVSPSEPHVVEHLDLDPIPRPTEFPSPRLSESAAIAALRNKVRDQAAADQFSGAVVIARHGQPIFREAYGFSDRENKIPNTPQTRFRLGSMNKIFTAVAVLQLVESGKIALDDSVGKFIRDYPNQDVAGKVTIKHLLTHTGGTGDIFGPEYNAHRNELRTLADYVKLYGNRNLEFEPGTRRAYSNYGFLLLGRIIEVASGQSYYDYVRDHIFMPAGMSRSGSEPEETPVPERAVAYTKANPAESWAPNRDNLPYRGTSAGGGYSTADDLLHFANALAGHTLLNAKSLDMLVNGEPLTPGGRIYAFGSGGRTWDGVRYFGHNGGYPGMNTDLEISIDSGYTIIVLSNFDPPTAQRISEFIGSRLPERSDPVSATN